MHRTALLVALALVAASCTGAVDPGDGDIATGGEPTTSAPPVAAVPTSDDVIVDDAPNLPPTLADATAAWGTDWTRRTIEFDELLIGIPGGDPLGRIPHIDDPSFQSVAQAEWLEGNQPGVVFGLDDDARFYPLSILTRHEIVNDAFGDIPVSVTYCPLCNTAVVFDRRVAGETVGFRVSGLLRNSDLVMWDDQTESLFQQVTGEGIVGTLAGERLTILPSRITSFDTFAEAHPEGTVLADDQGFGIRYGANPYVGYSSRPEPYGFFQGEPDDRLPALERVVGVEVGDEHVAYAFSNLAEARVVNDVVGGEPIAVFWGDPDTADALDDRSIAESRGVGTGVAYLATIDDEALTFQATGEDTWVDDRTGSTWDLFGTAVDGPMAGTQLELALHRNEFFFAWSAFFPDGEVREG